MTEGEGSAAYGRSTGWWRGFAVLGHREYALLWSGQSISQLGDGIYTVALVLEVLHADDRSSVLGLVLAARTVPTVLLLILGGAVVDRVDRRQVMVAADVARAVTVGTLAVLVAVGRVDVAALVALSVVFGTADAFFNPAASAVLPELLPRELIAPGNALNTTSSQLAQSLLGPAVGGLVVGVIGRSWSFGADAISFTVSIACLLAMRRGQPPERSGRSLGRDALAGLAFIRSRRWLLATMLAAAIANFFGLAPFGVLIPLLVDHTLHAGALGLGLVLAAGGLGGLIASLIVARLPEPRRRVTRMWTVYGLSGLTAAAMALAPDPAFAAVLDAATFGLIVYGDVLFFTAMQTMIPGEMLGRTFAVLGIIAVGLMPLGTVCAGFVAASMGVRPALALSGLLGGSTALVLLVPGVRESKTAVGAQATS